MWYNSNMSLDKLTLRKIEQYLEHARQSASTGRLVLAHGDLTAAINRAYYAIFYAANALLATKGLERSKHSGVIAAFRQHFVKIGIIEPEFSRSYGEAMEQRHAGDYDLLSPDQATAERSLGHAERFVQRIEQALRDMKAIS
jgi:uncharacterized protein (UPF0332 family)